MFSQTNAISVTNYKSFNSRATLYPRKISPIFMEVRAIPAKHYVLWASNSRLGIAASYFNTPRSYNLRASGLLP
jgi:hypothetical protein